MASLRRRGIVVGMKQRTHQWDSVLAVGASVDRELLTPAETVFVPVVQYFRLPSGVNKPPSKVVEVLGLQTWNSEVGRYHLPRQCLTKSPNKPPPNLRRSS